MLQKQREDLDRVTEENKVLKSRYENAVEVNVHYIEIYFSVHVYMHTLCDTNDHICRKFDTKFI